MYDYIKWIIIKLYICIIFNPGILAYGQQNHSNRTDNGQSIVLYISTKQLEFTPETYKLLAGFVQESDSLGLIYEELARAVAIKLGNFCIKLLSEKMSITPVIFLNSIPTAAQYWMENRYNNNFEVTDFQLLIDNKNINFLISIDTFRLHIEPRSYILAESNQLRHQKRNVKILHVCLRKYNLLDLNTPAEMFCLYYDEDQTITPPFPISENLTAAQQLFSLVLGTLFKKVLATNK
jgi:hypothetical protein